MRRPHERAREGVTWQVLKKAAKLLLQPTKTSMVLIFTQKSVLWVARKAEQVAFMLTVSWLVLLAQKADVYLAAPKKPLK